MYLLRSCSIGQVQFPAVELEVLKTMIHEILVETVVKKTAYVALIQASFPIYKLFLRCEIGFVMEQNGQCQRILPVTCKATGELHQPHWVLAAQSNKEPDHCNRGEHVNILPC